MRRFQKFFAGALSVSLIAASMFGCGAFAEETETAADVETAAETVGESTGTRTIVDHTGAEVVLPDRDQTGSYLFYSASAVRILPLQRKRR